MTFKDIIKITLNLVIIYAVGGVLLAGVYAKTSPIMFQKNKEEKEAALQRMMPLHLKAQVPEASLEQVRKVIPESAEVETTPAEGGTVVVDAKLDVYADMLEDVTDDIKDEAGIENVVEYSDFRPEKKGDWEPQHHHAEYYEVMYDGDVAGYIVETYGKGYSSYINIFVAIDKEYTVKKIGILHHAETPGLGDEIMMPWFKDQFRDKALDDLEVIKGETKEKIQAITGATISTRAVTNGVRDAVEMIKKRASGEGAESMAEASEGSDEH